MEISFLDSVESRQFARRFLTLLDTQLLSYKHYFPWADAIIACLDSPPLWVVQISTIKYQPEASRAVREFVYSEPFEEFNPSQLCDENVSCILIRYRIGAISWATFLKDAGCYVDSNDGRKECEYFFEMLNQFEDSEFNPDLQREQQRQVQSVYEDVLANIEFVYDSFMPYFRLYVKRTL